MQRLIKNSSSPPVHKAQARAAFCLLCHFPNRPRLELPLHRLCSSTALFPSSLSRCKGPPRTVFRLSWFTRPIWGERREFQWNIDAALLHLVFDTQGDLSTHEYKHNALMFLFFPSKRRRKKVNEFSFQDWQVFSQAVSHLLHTIQSHLLDYPRIFLIIILKKTLKQNKLSKKDNSCNRQKPAYKVECDKETICWASLGRTLNNPFWIPIHIYIDRT